MGKERKSNSRKSAVNVPGIYVKLDRAEGLPAADSNGKSDPFVKFEIKGFSKHKSSVIKKTLDPSWREEFFMECPDGTRVPLSIQVYDKDPAISDFLGSTEIDISELDMLNGEKQFELPLVNNKKKKSAAGKIFLTVSRVEKKLSELSSKSSAKAWALPTGKRRVVVELIKGMDLISKDSNGFSDPYVVLKLGKHKHTSKVRSRNLNPKWRQRFEFPWEEGESPILKLDVWDKDYLSKDDSMGSSQINLEHLQLNVVNDNWYDVILKTELAGHLHVLVTIMLPDHDMELTKEQRKDAVGSLKVHCIRAKGLLKADTFGKSDPYVELELSNARATSQIIMKTLDPVWDRVMELPVNDVFASLKLTVWDYDKASKPDLLGSLEIPLLKIKSGENQWFALKSKDLLKRGQGEIELSFKLKYNVPKAYMGVIKRREQSHMAHSPAFSTKRLKNNLTRLNAVGAISLKGMTVANDLQYWKLGVAPSVLAMIATAVFFLTFRLWMVPLGVLLAVVVVGLMRLGGNRMTLNESGVVVTAVKSKRNSLMAKEMAELGIAGDGGSSSDDSDSEPEPEEGEGKSKKKTKSKQSLVDQIRTLNRIGKQVQDIVEFAADFGERVLNLLNWSVPVITQLVCIGLVVATLLCVIIPPNVLLMLYIEFRFVKFGVRKYLKPRSKFHVPFIEAVELISRVPSNMDKIRYERLTTENGNNETKVSKKMK